MRVSGLIPGQEPIRLFQASALELNGNETNMDSIVQSELSGGSNALNTFREKRSDVYDQLKVLNYGQLLQQISQASNAEKPELIQGLVQLVVQAVTLVRKDLGNNDDKKDNRIMNPARSEDEEKSNAAIFLAPIAGTVGLNLSA